MKIIVMGVSGSGKTTVGSLLADELSWKFFDADDFHPPENREKMARGIPLTDEDRIGWLETLRTLLMENPSCVLACSALKKSYREFLTMDDQVRFVYLKGSFDQIEARMKNRKDHYMPVQLLTSQFNTLEEPEAALIVDITQPPHKIVAEICKGLNLS